MKSVENLTTSASTAELIVDYVNRQGQAKAHDLRQLLGISNVAIHKQLRKLCIRGEIKRVGTPPFVIYVSPKENEKKLLQLEQIKRKVLPVLKKACVTKAAIFGSHVRGDNTQESDIDILIELPDEATLFELGGLKVDLEEKLHRKVDVVPYKNIYPLIKDSVLSNQYSIL